MPTRLRAALAIAHTSHGPAASAFEVTQRRRLSTREGMGMLASDDVVSRNARLVTAIKEDCSRIERARRAAPAMLAALREVLRDSGAEGGHRRGEGGGVELKS